MPESPAIRPIQIAVAPTPITASGAVSAADLEKYVRWLRRTAIDGVLLWTEVGAGADLDLSEREELYTVWRGGLLPHQQVWVEVPAGGMSAAADEITFQAAHARELGADAVVVRDTSHAAQVQHLHSPDYQVICTDKSETTKAVSLSLAAAVNSPANCEAILRDLDPADLALLLLWVLAERKVISRGSVFTTEAGRSLDLSVRAIAAARECLHTQPD